MTTLPAPEIFVPEHPAYTARRRREKRWAIVEAAYRLLAIVIFPAGLMMAYGCQPKPLPDGRAENGQGVGIVTSDVNKADVKAADLPPKIEIVYGAVPQKTADVKDAYNGAIEDVKDIRAALDDIKKTGLPHFEKADQQTAAAVSQFQQQHATDVAALKAEDHKIVGLELAGGIFVASVCGVLIWFGQVVWGIAGIIGSVIDIVLCEVVLQAGHAIGFIGLALLAAGAIALLIYELHKKHVNVGQLESYAWSIGKGAIDKSEEAWRALVDEGEKLFSRSTKTAVAVSRVERAKDDAKVEKASAPLSIAA